MGLSIHPQAALQLPICSRCCYPSPPPLGTPSTSQPPQDSEQCPMHLPPGPPAALLLHPLGCTDVLSSHKDGEWLGNLGTPALCCMDAALSFPPTPPAPWEPLGHHGPELPRLPELTMPQAGGGWPCGTGLCAIPGGLCSIRTGVGMLRSAAADARGCCTGLGCCEEGGMELPSPWAPLSPGQVGLPQRAWQEELDNKLCPGGDAQMNL